MSPTTQVPAVPHTIPGSQPSTRSMHGSPTFGFGVQIPAQHDSVQFAGCTQSAPGDAHSTSLKQSC
jgi:hypothetical protein